MAKNKGRKRLQMGSKGSSVPGKFHLSRSSREYGLITPEFREVVEQNFHDMHGDLEPLTDQLINRLITQGWNESLLRDWQKAGNMAYSRKRNSFWEVG